MNFRLIAFDAATTKTGYAVVDVADDQIKLINVGVIQGKGEMCRRLAKLSLNTKELLELYQPNFFTVEDIKINPGTINIPSKMKVNYAVGIVMSEAGKLKLPEPVCINARSMRSRWGVKSNDKGKLRRAVNIKYEIELKQLGYDRGLTKNQEDISDAIGHAVAVANIIMIGENLPPTGEEVKPKKKKLRTDGRKIRQRKVS